MSRQQLLFPYTKETKGFFLNPFPNSKVLPLNNIGTLNAFRTGQDITPEKQDFDFFLSISNFILGVMADANLTEGNNFVSKLLTRTVNEGKLNQITLDILEKLEFNNKKFEIVKEKFNISDLVLGYVPFYFNDTFSLFGELTLSRKVYLSENGKENGRDVELSIRPIVSIKEKGEDKEIRFFDIEQETSLLCMEFINNHLTSSLYALKELNLFILPNAEKVITDNWAELELFSLDDNGERVEINSIDMVFECLGAKRPSVAELFL